MKRLVLLYGIVGGALIVLLRLIDYRFLVIERSLEIYGGIVAALFSAIGLWLGWRFTARKERIVVQEVRVEVPVAAATPAVPDPAQVAALSITPRELEILQAIADGLSTKEMAERLFLSENTIKTHCSRLFEKLQVNRRTQAVQRGKAAGLIA